MPEHTHNHRLSLTQFMAAQADERLSALVPMAGLLAEAYVAENRPLGQARISDCYATFADLCPCQLRGLLVIAAVELHRAGWLPDEHPDALAVDINTPLGVEPPEVKW